MRLCDICVYHLGLFVFFPGVFLSSRLTGACPVTTDLIVRVNSTTTTTPIFRAPRDNPKTRSLCPFGAQVQRQKNITAFLSRRQRNPTHGDSGASPSSRVLRTIAFVGGRLFGWKIVGTSNLAAPVVLLASCEGRCHCHFSPFIKNNFL